MPKTCSIDGCTSPAKGQGWCSKHWQRWKKHGDPLKVAWERGNPRANFNAKVDKRGPDDCWPWLGYTDPDGYGHFAVPAGRGQRDMPAHRYSYILEFGSIPERGHLDHLCHTRSPDCLGGVTCLHRRCVNPAHLEPVTPGENIRRAPVSPGQRRAGQQKAKTHCPSGHPYDEANTYISPRNHRRCRTCDGLRARAVRVPVKRPATCRLGHPFDATNTYVDKRNRYHCRACARRRDAARRKSAPTQAT